MKKQLNKPSLGEYQKRYKWESFEIRYYDKLEFFEVAASIQSIAKKRTISQHKAINKPYYSKAYFDKDSNLLRLDQIGANGIPSEAYIEYLNDLPIKAYEYYLGLNSQQNRVSSGGELSVEWDYKYDRNGKLIELIDHSYPDLEFTYEYHNHLYVHRYYEYDKDGLYRIYKYVEGLVVDGKPWKNSKHLVYDREREKFLRTNTVSITPLISKINSSKTSDLFILGGSPQKDISIPICPKCKKKTSYIGQVNLDKSLHKRNISPSQLPIFYCFKCLENQVVSLNHTVHETQRDDIRFFTQTNLSFVRSHNEEAIKDAFVKIGGLPDWIQNEEYPKCNECGNTMIFVCQINSAESIYNGEDTLMFGDSGKLYVFACCNSVATIMQCY